MNIGNYKLSKTFIMISAVKTFINSKELSLHNPLLMQLVLKDMIVNHTQVQISTNQGAKQISAIKSMYRRKCLHTKNQGLNFLKQNWQHFCAVFIRWCLFLGNAGKK